MQRPSTIAGVILIALLLPLAHPGAAQAGDTTFQGTLGANIFQAFPPCPVKSFPTFESLNSVPKIIDPFEEDLIPFFCQVQVTREGKGVKKAKGKFEADLIVFDNNTGEAVSFPVGSGRFRTNNGGQAVFDFDLPAELFADGFESGDVSAWSYTRTDFTNKKKSDTVSVSCDAAASKTE